MTEENGTLEIQFNNYGGTTSDMPATTTGSKTDGINIYSQIFPRSKAFVDEVDNSKIIEILGTVIKVSEGYVLDHIGDNNNLYSNVDFVEDSNPNTYVMGKNQVLVYDSVQGPDSPQGSPSLKYRTLYCYLKDKDGNAWLIYITGSDLRPIVFDLQDNMQPKFGGVESSVVAHPTISSVDTGNFRLVRVQGETVNDSHWPTSVPLKNTTFNLASDDTSESEASITYLGVFKPKANPKAK